MEKDVSNERTTDRITDNNNEEEREKIDMTNDSLREELQNKLQKENSGNNLFVKDNVYIIEEGPEKADKSKMDLDTILAEELGQFGLYQLRMMLMAVIVVIFSAWAAVEFIFTAGNIETRCFIQECESLEQIEFSPSWISYAIPASGSSFDNCQRFANVSSVTPEPGTCSANLFNQQSLQNCESYVYANTNTAAYDLDLACNDWRRSMIGTLRTTGVLFAMPLTGYVSDHWGRRTALVINAFNTACIGAFRYFVNTYAGFVAFVFLEAVFGAGGFTCAYILVMELVGAKYRVAAGATMNTFFAIGQVTMSLMAWGVPNWRVLILIVYIPQLITISYIWLVSESVRWYMSKDHYDKAEAVLRKVASVNKRQLSEKSLLGLRETMEEEKRKKAIETEIKASEPWLVVLVFRHKRILVRCIVSPVWWITTTLIYYGLTVKSVNLSGNGYLNYVAVSAVEIPGFWISFALVERIGRKPVIIGGFWICAACQLSYIFMGDGPYWLSLLIYLIGKCSIAAVLTALYVYTAELYPTRYRSSLFAFSSMMGRIGSLVAPLMPALGNTVMTELPFLLFAGFALLSGLLVFVTPETLGTKFPDTMDQASDIGKKEEDSA